MKFILSRKGFDSTYGGMPSPVFPDGTMLSLPIPEITAKGSQEQGDGSTNTGTAFEHLNLPKDQKELLKNNRHKYCHLDPDIRKGLHQSLSDSWKPLFGQCRGPQTHLASNGVKPGDIFLFFGTFRQVILKDKSWQFTGAPFHAIWGYMEIAEILSGTDIERYPWHPHSHKPYTECENNTLYIGREKLSLIGMTDYPGYGVFKLNPALILTLPNKKKRLSCWDYTKLPWLDLKKQEANMTGHTPKPNAKDERRQPGFKNKDGYHCQNPAEIAYFQSASIGQEFIITENKTDAVVPWFRSLLKSGS